MTKRKYADCFLKPDILQAGEFQVFELNGKDSRGYDYTFRVAPVSENTVPGDLPEKSPADRVEMLVGGKPTELEKTDGELEIVLGAEKEAHRLDKATMVYIPGNTPVQHKLIRKPADTTWLFSFTLTPKWEGPAKKQEGK